MDLLGCLDEPTLWMLHEGPSVSPSLAEDEHIPPISASASTIHTAPSANTGSSSRLPRAASGIGR